MFAFTTASAPARRNAKPPKMIDTQMSDDDSTVAPRSG